MTQTADNDPTDTPGIPANLPPGVVWESLRADQKQAWHRQEAVLAAYRETGTLADAARAVGLSPRTAYRYEEADILGFRARLDVAAREHGESLVKLMHTRLTDPKGNRGSDILLMFALKASFPDRYRDTSVVVDSTAKDLLSELRKRSRIRKRQREETGDDDPTPVEEAERLLARRRGQQPS